MRHRNKAHRHIRKVPSVNTNSLRKRAPGVRSLIVFFALGLAACSSLFLFNTRAANPAGGSIGPTIGGTPVTWVGDVTGTGAELGEAQCIDDGPGKNCDSFALTVTGVQADWTSKVLKVRINWSLGSNDYDVYIHKGDLTGPVAGKGPGSSQPNTEEVAFLNPSIDGVGLYTVHVAYAAVAPNSDQYHGAASVVPGVAPAIAGTGLAPRFQNFYPQPEVIKTGKGTDAGEPSIGVNWSSGRSMFISSLTTFRVTFDDSCPTSPTSTWEDKSAPNSQESLDPILFTDHGYNLQIPELSRTFVSQLTGQDSLSSYTDDDGENWTPSQGGGIPSGVDHQSIGGGPFRAPLMGAVYNRAVYYCSQDIVAFAFCARSDDGGLTFGPGVPTYSTECVGIHGHVKVGPDGAVYVPNRDCAGNEAAVVSEDNGMSWSIRPIPGTISSSSDPAVAIGRGDVVKTSDNKPLGRLYESFGGGDSIAGVAVSDDRGLTWKNGFDVGSLVGVKSIAFPAIVAGDDDRAAFAFLGSTVGGAPDDRAFTGTWHLYIATTYDGGAHWLVSDATPNDPVQRNGIHLGGGSPPHRNLLDFIGIDVDRQGRVLVAYADGCTGDGCVQGSTTSTGNSYTDVAAIARQTGGRRLFAGNDPIEPTIPGAPLLTVGRDGGVAHLTWSESDNGGSAITNRAIFRGTASGNEVFLANAGVANNYNDITADANTNYYYKVTAANALGASCGSNEVLSKPIGDSQCAGLKEVGDPTGDQRSAPANADLDVLEVRLADYVATGNKIVFRLKVADLSVLQPNRQWRIIWNYPIRATNIAAANFTGTYYVGMNTDGSSVPSFEYGTVTTVEAVPANTSIPHRIGDADSGTIDQATGMISIVLSAEKIGGPAVGDVIGALVGRTFAGNGNDTVLSSSSVDTTSRAIQDPYTGNSYRLVGNAPCALATPTPTPTPTVTPTPTPTVTPTPTPTPTVSPTPTVTPTPTPTPTVTPTPTPSVTPTPTPSVSPTPTVTPTPTPTPTTTVQFSQTVYSVTEGCVQTLITVTRTGPTGGVSTVDYTVNNATATQRGDFTYSSGTIVFNANETSKTFPVLISEDGYTEGTESATVQLNHATGASIGTPSAASLQIQDNDFLAVVLNPIDDAATFVGQHYHDFLNRQADTNGQTFWTNQITSCGNNASCVDEKRTNVSAAFFLSVEFQNTGYFAFRFYRASFPDNAQRPRGVPRYLEFLRDEQKLQDHVVVGDPNWEAFLEQNKQGFALDWVDRADFIAEYPTTMTRDEYIDKLFTRSGATPTTQERNQALFAYDSGFSVKEKRAKGIRAVIDTGAVYNAQYNPAFVLMQYFGYLRRNPNNAPDNNFSGYDFWLNKMNQFSVAGEDVRDANVALARVKRAEMVKAFIFSGEYRGRFGGDSSQGQQFGSVALAKPGSFWNAEVTASQVWLAVISSITRTFAVG